MNKPIIDPDLRDELEDVNRDDPDLTSIYGSSNKDGDGETLDVLRDFMPDEVSGKTEIAVHQAHALAAGQHLPMALDQLGYDVGEDLQELFDMTVEEYMVLLTSIQGKNVNRLERILRAVFGENVEQKQIERSWADQARSLLSNPPEADNGE